MFDEFFEKHEKIVFFDTETTGYSAKTEQVIELAAKAYTRNGGEEEMDEFIALHARAHVPERITEITRITDETLLAYGRDERQVISRFARMIEGDTLLVAYNARFDLAFIDAAMERHGIPRGGHDYFDPMEVFKKRHPEGRHKLSDCITRYGLDGVAENTHRAIDDVNALVEVTKAMEKETGVKVSGRRYAEISNTPLSAKAFAGFMNDMYLIQAKAWDEAKRLPRGTKMFDGAFNAWSGKWSGRVACLDAYTTSREAKDIADRLTASLERDTLMMTNRPPGTDTPAAGVWEVYKAAGELWKECYNPAHPGASDAVTAAQAALYHPLLKTDLQTLSRGLFGGIYEKLRSFTPERAEQIYLSGMEPEVTAADIYEVNCPFGAREGALGYKVNSPERGREGALGYEEREDDHSQR